MWLTDLMTYGGMLNRVQTARKEHRCDQPQCPEGGVIKPGTRYATEIAPPWLMTQDDPDSRPFKLGEWIVRKYHIGTCDPYYYL